MSNSVTMQQLNDAYTAYADDLYRFCYTRTFHEQDAWDVIQDAFMNLHQYLAAGKAVENVRVFLFQVVANLIIDRARSRKRRHDQEIPLESLREFGIELACEEELHAKVQRKMEAGATLKLVRERSSEEDYNIFVLRYINGLMPTDIAEITGFTSNNVSVRLHRIVKDILHSDDELVKAKKSKIAVH